MTFQMNLTPEQVKISLEHGRKACADDIAGTTLGWARENYLAKYYSKRTYYAQGYREELIRVEAERAEQLVWHARAARQGRLYEYAYRNACAPSATPDDLAGGYTHETTRLAGLCEGCNALPPSTPGGR